MGIYKYIRDSYREYTDEVKQLWRQRIIAWRRDPVTLRIEYPTRLDRARNAGYKAKEGVILVRQRVIRGGPQETRQSRRKAFKARDQKAHFGIELSSYCRKKSEFFLQKLRSLKFLFCRKRRQICMV